MPAVGRLLARKVLPVKRFAIFNEFLQLVDDTDDPNEARQLVRSGDGYFAYALAPEIDLESLLRFLEKQQARRDRQILLCDWKRDALKRDRHCAFCRRPLTNRSATAEHLTPLSRGGTDDPDNLALACHDCNQAKGESTLEEFRERLRSGILFADAAVA